MNDIDICNAALSRLGAKSINRFDESNKPIATIDIDQYGGMAIIRHDQNNGIHHISDVEDLYTTDENSYEAYILKGLNYQNTKFTGHVHYLQETEEERKRRRRHEYESISAGMDKTSGILVLGGLFLIFIMGASMLVIAGATKIIELLL